MREKCFPVKHNTSNGRCEFSGCSGHVLVSPVFNSCGVCRVSSLSGLSTHCIFSFNGGTYGQSLSYSSVVSTAIRGNLSRSIITLCGFRRAGG